MNNSPFVKLSTSLFPFVDFLYILQLEEYNVSGYSGWIKTRWWKRNFQKAGEIDWTLKAKVLFILAVLLYLTLITLFALSDISIYGKISGIIPVISFSV